VLSRADFVRAFINTMIVSASAVLLSLCLGVPAAYAFARFPFTGRSFLFFALLVMRMLPPIAVLVPMYVLFSKLGLTTTRFSVVLAYTTFSLQDRRDLHQRFAGRHRLAVHGRSGGEAQGHATGGHDVGIAGGQRDRYETGIPTPAHPAWDTLELRCAPACRRRCWDRRPPSRRWTPSPRTGNAACGARRSGDDRAGAMTRSAG
jgi:hypothetical protein